VPTNKIFGRTPSASGPTPSSTKTVMPRLYLMKGERGNLQFSLSIIISTSISSEFIYLIAEFLFFKKKKKKKREKITLTEHIERKAASECSPTRSLAEHRRQVGSLHRPLKSPFDLLSSERQKQQGSPAK
jgi:hypothetical protein